jgi:hypothetical protein
MAPTLAPAHTTIAAQAPASPGIRLLELMRNVANGLVPHARYQLGRFGPAGIVGVVASAASALITALALVSLQAVNDDLKSQILRAQHRHATTTTPEQGVMRMVEQFPTRAQMPVVLGQVLQQAQAAGIELAKGQYSYRPATPSELGRYELDFPVTGQYPAIRDFINRILTNVPAAGLHKLIIQRKVVGDPQVNADVHFIIFVRDR